MWAQRLWCGTLILFLALLSVPVAGSQTPAQSDQKEIAETLKRLVEGPDRKDIQWKVEIQRPHLMYLQYYLVDIYIQLHSDVVKRDGSPHHLYFVSKLKDANGQWIEGHNRAEMALRDGLDRKQDIQASLASYVRPGTYEIVIAAYESTTGAASVARKQIRVPATDEDKLPELDTHLFPVAFPNSYPQLPAPKQTADGELFEVHPFASALEFPVPEPTRIDVVVSVSKRDQIPPVINLGRARWGRRISPTPVNPEAVYRYELGRTLQVAYVLSQIRPANGCVTMTVIDPTRRRVLADTAEVRNRNWQSVMKSVDATDQLTVDARQLADKRGAAVFAQRFFERLATTQTGCAEVTPKRRYVVLVNHTLDFPEYHGEHISPAAAESAIYYQFYNHPASFSGDELPKVLKPADVRDLSFSDPEDFRKSLARYVRDVRAGK